MSDPNSTLTRGWLLQNGRYRIIGRIGKGGMGRVYEAYDNRLQTKVAIKEALKSESKLKRAFEREGQRLNQLSNHQALPNLTDYFIENGRQYLVMDFIEGQNLKEMLRNSGKPFNEKQVLKWADQLLDVLGYLHSKDMTHLDIKPDNIKQTPDGKLFLLDLGLAKGGLASQTLTGQGVHGYTLGYAPPEQIAGLPTDKRSDIYSLGATLYTLLTNEVPKDAKVRKLANQLNPKVSPHIAQALEGAMALKPADRPQSVQEMRAMLNGRRNPALHKRSRHKPIATRIFQGAIIAVVLLVVVLIGAYIIPPNGNGNPAPPIIVAPTDTPTPTSIVTVTLRPTHTTTPTPTATATLPIPPSLAVISAENASELGEIACRDSKGQVREVVYSPNGKLLAVGTSKGIELRNAETLEVEPLLDSQEEVNTIAFSPDSKWLAADRSDFRIQLWNFSDEQLSKPLLPHSAKVASLSFSPNDSLLASGSYDKTVRLWRLPDGQLLKEFSGHTDVESVSFSPDGSLLASGSKDQTVRLWNVSERQHFKTLRKHSDTVWSVSVSKKDGSLVASSSSDNTVQLWHVSNAQPFKTLEGHTSKVNSVNFSPDDSVVASGSSDNTVRLWRVSDGQLLKTLEGHALDVTSVSFSPDGRLLVSGSYDGTIRLWGVVEQGLQDGLIVVCK